MPTVDQIKAKYKKKHDKQASEFYTKKHSIGVSPEEQTAFDLAHAKLWSDMAVDIKAASDYVEPATPRDLENDLDKLITWAKTAGYGD